MKEPEQEDSKKSSKNLKKETILDRVAKYDRELSTTVFMIFAFFTLWMVLVGLFVLTIMKVTVKDGLMSIEVVHLILMGALGLVQSVGGFLFGKKMSEGNGKPKEELPLEDKLAALNKELKALKGDK